MIVKCIRKYWKDFDNELVVNKLKNQICMSEGYEDLEVGRVYIVYGIVFWSSQETTNYYICDYSDSTCPSPVPADFFEVLDGKIPSEWNINFKRYDDGDNITNFVFEEWANNEIFYENLVDGELEEEEIFKNYKMSIIKKIKNDSLNLYTDIW